MNTIKHLLFLVAAFVLFACNNKQEAVEQESSLIEITNQQFSTDAMQLGKIEVKTFESTINCTGSIVPQPDGVAKVTAPVPGIIKKVYCHYGQIVGKDQDLLEIGGHEVIDLQKEFAEASAHYKRIKSEYERIGSLYTEKVTSEKDFILAESDYKASMARYNGYKMKIEALGFSVSKIENGEFYPSYVIKAPIKGHISKVDANLGSYIEPQTKLIEIIDPERLQVKLMVYATDISNVKTGQTVRFKSLNSGIEHVAKLRTIGVEVGDDTKTIECSATIDHASIANPIANQFVECVIVTEQVNLPALPTDAIARSETGNFILILEKQEKTSYFFRKTPVKIGMQADGFTEIVNPKADSLLLIHGGYNISL